MHFVSSDGFDIYVGKNNIQNDELTFKTGNGNDWWFHAKQMPGSHVLLKQMERKFLTEHLKKQQALPPITLKAVSRKS